MCVTCEKGGLVLVTGSCILARNPPLHDATYTHTHTHTPCCVHVRMHCNNMS